MAKKLPTVAIIGQANVGKSSLFNRLVRARQAIVAKEAGTTRDNVVGKVSYLRRDVDPETFTSSTPPPSHSLLPFTPGVAQNGDTRAAVALQSTAGGARDGVSSGIVGDTVEPSAISYSEEAVDFSEDKIQPNATGWPTATRRVYSEEDEVVVGEQDELKSPAPQSSIRDASRVTSGARDMRRGENGWGDGRTEKDDDHYSHFWLVDTAGLKTAEDEFEATIQEQIDEAVDAADAILVMVDSTMYPTDQDRLVAKKALKSKKPVILIVNKSDLKGALPTDEFKRLGIKAIIRTSAEHNQGISELLDEIAKIIPEAKQKEEDETIRAALIGRPNVGKSHLFNTLAGKQQAVVANVAGTTRDLNRITVRYEKQSIELIDTAGIRRQGKQETGIEKFSVLRTMQAINEADVCMLLMDVNELNTQLDQRLAGLIDEAGKGLIIVVSKWDSVKGKDAYTRDQLAPQISYHFKFTPWAPLIFTSSVTGQNVTKLFDLILDIYNRRRQETKTRKLNDMLQKALIAHPPAGLKNTHPKLRYIVQTDTAPPWFVIYGSNLKFVHWSYKRYLERQIRDIYDYSGTPIKLSFRDEKQIKSNRERIKQGKEPVTKAYKKAKEAEKHPKKK